MEHPTNNNETNNNLANRLNQECYCRTLDRKVLNTSLQDQLAETRNNPIGANELNKLFSATPVFVPKTEIKAMERIVSAIESVAELPSYQEKVLSWAPEIAAFDPGPIGALMGYDFHLGSDGPQLIEVNTNAGGAFLNVLLARAQKRCCNPSEQSAATNQMLDRFEEAVFDMFKQEWQRQSAVAMPNRIAIVDNDPESQFMFLEFELACQLLQARGIDTVILDPSELEYIDGTLTAHGQKIDMIYNRLVDFAFEDPDHVLLKQAYLEGAVVVTPNPRVHAMLANKQNLTLLSDSQILRSWGLDEAAARYLERSVPRTKIVSRDDAAELWLTRRQLFFKPVAGHGSKGVYRGSKLTRRVFENILDESYIAQTFIPATERSLKIDDVVTTRKVDIRLYTYGGKLLLPAARVYQGQVTNFRTSGGGFAPVFQV
ncbi:MULTISPECIES: hypothetical protein [Psychrobacter]|jgi:hypothetical protein|uniref:hypothetical protein n=1 Tax=Psychrobacter TaxID=497 RepID=UPI000C349A6C|nr:MULTISPECIES: hypothetical protein [Psychrobacter]MBA6245550.1 hypothetical protein [Psychrobacter sp. Urea-trap-18]MBA6284691.1 hypothetical protein [Psychrobacter sp. Urea-trap-16]MBA6318165.1 hypothetical protein [Psychrobacter sp. Urea-trap-20]MBA6332996.1 hypothetical protein [Psychrobacter sp. Urea-trap-19]PKG59837.1 hypothetical protein CXF63_10180 [Psychrobacter sp. Choline-3u-12]